MEPVVARKMWRTLEPYHGLIYFSPEATAAYEALGVMGFDGYFASRSAPMGAVPAEVVIATFFNFNPVIVHRALPAAWEASTPARLLDARLHAAGASLPWPDDPALVLWHAVTLLREFRGDGHVACLVDAELEGIDALVLHAASGEVPRAALQTTRGWEDAAWHASVERLADRGLVDIDGGFTEAGRRFHQHIEDRTDALALRPWRALGEERCDELRSLVRPLSKAIVASGALGR